MVTESTLPKFKTFQLCESCAKEADEATDGNIWAIMGFPGGCRHYVQDFEAKPLHPPPHLHPSAGVAKSVSAPEPVSQQTISEWNLNPQRAVMQFWTKYGKDNTDAHAGFAELVQNEQTSREVLVQIALSAFAFLELFVPERNHPEEISSGSALGVDDVAAEEEIMEQNQNTTIDVPVLGKSNIVVSEPATKVQKATEPQVADAAIAAQAAELKKSRARVEDAA